MAKEARRRTPRGRVGDELRKEPFPGADVRSVEIGLRDLGIVGPIRPEGGDPARGVGSGENVGGTAQEGCDKEGDRIDVGRRRPLGGEIGSRRVGRRPPGLSLLLKQGIEYQRRVADRLRGRKLAAVGLGRLVIRRDRGFDLRRGSRRFGEHKARDHRVRAGLIQDLVEGSDGIFPARIEPFDGCLGLSTRIALGPLLARLRDGSGAEENNERDGSKRFHGEANLGNSRGSRGVADYK